MWNRTQLSQNARTHGLGWRTAHASSIDEKSLINPWGSFRPASHGHYWHHYILRKKEISAPGWKPAGGLVILLPTSKTDNNQAVNAEALRDVSIVMWRQGRHNLISCLQFKLCLKVSCLNGVFWKPRGHWGHQDHTKWIGAESPEGEQRIPKDSSRVLWAEPCSVLASFSCAFLITLYFMIWVCSCMIPHIRHDPKLQDFIICCFGRFRCSPVPGKSVQRNATKCCWRHALWHVLVDMLAFNW